MLVSDTCANLEVGYFMISILDLGIWIQVGYECGDLAKVIQILKNRLVKPK